VPRRVEGALASIETNIRIPDRNSTISESEPITVVLAEDRHDLRLLLRVVFEGAGLRVLAETGDGTSAVPLVADRRPDVVVVDLALPGTEGPELVGLLRMRHPDIGIVVFSGSVEPGIEERVIELGADRFVAKGTPLDELAAVVREVAARHTPRP
jgi:two-component system NarL family response regulator